MGRRALPRPRAEVVTFGNFEWLDPRTGVSVTVHGKEVESIFHAIAECNDVPAATLLQNCQVKAGEPLQCHQAKVLPRGWSWQVDSAGYLLVKLKGSFVPRAHSSFEMLETTTQTMNRQGSANGAYLLHATNLARLSAQGERAGRVCAQERPLTQAQPRHRTRWVAISRCKLGSIAPRIWQHVRTLRPPQGFR